MGNRETVVIKHEGQRERVFLEASPGTNSINVYNGKNERISLSNSKIQVIQEEKGKELPDQTKKVMEKANDLNQDQKQKKKIS
jgi:exopolysaccharide biosynthesis protein